MSQAESRRSRPLSQVEIERTLVETVEELESLTESYELVIKRAAEAEAAHKVAHARAYLRATGTNRDSRQAYADSLTEDTMQAHLLTEAIAKYHREAMVTKRNALEMLRTLNANLRPLIDNRLS